MRIALLSIALVACGSKSKPPPDNHHQTGDYAIAVPTTEPVPESDREWAGYLHDDFEVVVYDDGMVWWRGNFGMGSFGVRHARLPEDTFAALQRAFEDADFLHLPDPEVTELCADGLTAVALSRTVNGEVHSIGYIPCPAVPVLDRLLQQVHTLIGLDQFIRGNPEGPLGPLPDGDHVLAQLTRTSCYPEGCPAFEVTLFDDGTVVWRGDSDVAVVGEARATVPSSVVDEVIAMFEEARFFELDDLGNVVDPEAMMGMCGSGADVSSAITRYQRDGRRHQTYNPHCGDVTPLWALEDLLQARLVADQKWISE